MVLGGFLGLTVTRDVLTDIKTPLFLQKMWYNIYKIPYSVSSYAFSTVLQKTPNNMSLIVSRKTFQTENLREGLSMFNKSGKKLVMVLVILLALGTVGTVLASQDTSEAIRLSSSTSALVFQTDFGVQNDAVASMKGVAFCVDPNLKMFDLTHEVPAFDIWEAAYWLSGAAPYWPEGTVFVSVVDPGVGTDRKSVVLKTKTGQYFITPDNGTLTLVAENLGIEAVREIDEETSRLEGSEQSYTFYGRDIFALTGARLASGMITFEEVGKLMEPKVEMISYQKAEIKDDAVWGMVTVLDQPFGNVWTSIPKKTFEDFGIAKGDVINVCIMKNGEKIYEGKMPYVNTFGDVEVGEPLLYMNSELRVAFAINMDNFAATHNIKSGAEWGVK
jgi:S-adenosylmethionine hydrolase